MNILAIDTSTLFASVTIFVKHKIFTINKKNIKSHHLFILPMIKKVINESKIEKNEIDLLYYGKGPGSFVGIRLSSSIIQAMSLVLNIPIVDLSSMYTIALNAVLKTGSHFITIIFNVDKNYIYFGQYNYNKNKKVLETLKELFLKKTEFDQMNKMQLGRLIVYNNKNNLEYYPDTQFLYQSIINEYNFRKNYNLLNKKLIPIYNINTN